MSGIEQEYKEYCITELRKMITYLAKNGVQITDEQLDKIEEDEAESLKVSKSTLGIKDCYKENLKSL